MGASAVPIDAGQLSVDGLCVAHPNPSATPLIPTGSRSRHWIAAPQVLRPGSIEEAQQAFDAWPDAVPLGGGLDIVNRMKEGWQPGPLVALGGIAALTRIGIDLPDVGMGSPASDAVVASPDTTIDDKHFCPPAPHTLFIGAAVRHDTLAGDATLRACLPDLADCWDRIANIRIRMQGTVAGNLFAGMPGYEAAVLLAAMDARLVGRKHDGSALLVPVAGWRPAGEKHGPRWITGITIALPAHDVQRRLFYDRSLRPALSVALALDLRGTTVIAARAVVGGCHAYPVVCEIPVRDLPLPALRDAAKSLATVALSDLPAPTVPWTGDASYRPRIAAVLLTRLLRGSVS